MPNSASHTNQIWALFSFAAWTLAAGMMTGGIYFLEASFSAKGFYAMSAIMLVYTSVAITKAVRDNEEANRMINRVEEAKAEKLIMDVTSDT